MIGIIGRTTDSWRFGRARLAGGPVLGMAYGYENISFYGNIARVFFDGFR